MHETVDTYLVDKYVAELRQELFACGILSDKAAAVIAETRDHLGEAIADAAPTSAKDVERILTQFGSPRRMARALAAEQEQARAVRRFPWPALYSAIGILMLINYMFGGRILDVIWTGTLFLIASAVALFIMGWIGRRPLIAQFVIGGTAMTVFLTCWFAATSYPLPAYGGFVAVPRRHLSEFQARIKQNIGQQRAVMPAIKRGLELFRGDTPRGVMPAEFTYNGKFWNPEGVRELLIGIPPKEISPMLLMSWPEAVRSWQSSEPGHLETWAEEIARTQPSSVASQEKMTQDLEYISQQGVFTQLPLDFAMAGRAALMFAIAGLTTNAGWLSYCLWRSVRRLVRRLTFRSLQTA